MARIPGVFIKLTREGKVDKRFKRRNDGKKECTICRVLLGYEFFHKAGRGSVGGCTNQCKRCVSAEYAPEEYTAKKHAQASKWKKNNPIAMFRISRREHLKRLYGISENGFLDKHSDRNGCCDICGKQCRSGPSHDLGYKCDLHIDHCHKTGSFRGLLCITCNTGIGNLKDDPELISRALNYLKRHGIQIVRSE